MAFIPITDPEIDVGDPVTKELWDKVQGNFDNHETRLNQLETASQTPVIFDFALINAASFSTLTGFAFFRVPFSFTLTDAKVVIFDKGSLVGTLQIDVKVNNSLNPAGFVSVFTTRPSINVGASPSYTESSNAVFDSGLQDLVEGQYLRLDVTSMPTGGTLGKMFIYLIGEI